MYGDFNEKVVMNVLEGWKSFYFNKSRDLIDWKKNAIFINKGKCMFLGSYADDKIIICIHETKRDIKETVLCSILEIICKCSFEHS